MRIFLLVVIATILPSCGSVAEGKEASCVTLRCDGDGRGWATCSSACGACIDISHAVVSTKPEVCF